MAEYRIYPKYSDRQDWSNSVDPYQTPLMRRLIGVCTVCHTSSSFRGINMQYNGLIEHLGQNW